ncbi:MAG: radical SAM protein [Pseudomonadota bacterium]
MPDVMSEAQIRAFARAATARQTPPDDPRQPLRSALQKVGHYGAGQTAGRFYPGACVALEVTQRCNLDCTLCYLSEAAELAHDPPLAVLFSRIDDLACHYGPGANIQITGGDPTLRKVEDLEALCRHIRQHGMRSCLMTNGIKASREMLTRLRRAGLDDVAFHVDLTQERKGYHTEAALNAIRHRYIERTRGLGLRILFNTTIYDGNLAEIPVLAAFFRDHAADITLTSFQMQADTGRGVLRARDEAITQNSVMAAIARGMGSDLDFDTAAVGHSECNRFTMVLVAGGKAVSLLSNRPLFERAVAAVEAEDDPSDSYVEIGRSLRRAALRHPLLALNTVGEALRVLWRLRSGLTAGRPHRLSILVHNFMDASELRADRCEACVFKVATADGPLSMCVHNAHRDDHLFAPAPIATGGTSGWWSAATGTITSDEVRAKPALDTAPLKRLKGRQRARALENHPNKARRVSA